MSRIVLLMVAHLVFFNSPLFAGDKRVDLDMVNRIRDEGFNRSQVMQTLAHLTDQIGPRLTGSPQMKEANEWTRDKLVEWGLENAHLESWGPFGRGWSFSRTSVHLLKPHQTPLLALPKAWTPATVGPIRGAAMIVKLESEKDFEQQRGKLAGKILLIADARQPGESDEPLFRRYDREQLDELLKFPIPRERRPDRRRQFIQRWKVRQKINEFLTAEKALATIDISSRDAGILRLGGGGSREIGKDPGVPSVVLIPEQYNRIYRMLKNDQEVVIEIDVAAAFHDDDTMAYNTIAEIPGSDKKDQLVMVGAHLDSWHVGTGATDNASGSAVAMEAVRILQAIGVQPRRTIRIALWSGEEQGLLGSRAHVSKHFASRPAAEDPEQKELPSFLREDRGPLTIKPDHEFFSAYFNLDNGSGKIRGIYCQENAAVRPIFEAWMRPFADLGADAVSLRNTGGTDHLAFDAVGLPGFQFIQDRLAYSTRTHHSNLDVYDHLKRDDLMQASVIMASFIYQAAMRDERLPRKPMPRDEPQSRD